MAGVKVTDLPNLNTADSADIFYVVDESANQSKKVDLATVATALNALLTYIPLKGTAFTGNGQVTGDIEVDVANGGLMTLRFPSGDIIGVGVDYGGYSAMSFYNASVNQTVYLYNRGGDLYIENVDTGEGTGAIIAQITGLNATKMNYIDGFNQSGQTPPAAFNNIFKGDDLKQYLGNGSGTYRGLTKLPSHYFVDSCSYTQTGTNAPQEITAFETQVGSGIVTKQISYVSTGRYDIKYLMLQGFGFAPQANKIKIITSGGEEPHVCISHSILIQQEIIGLFTYDTVTITIFTRQPSNNNLADNHLTASPIDVYFYE